MNRGSKPIESRSCRQDRDGCEGSSVGMAAGRPRRIGPSYNPIPPSILLAIPVVPRRGRWSEAMAQLEAQPEEESADWSTETPRLAMKDAAFRLDRAAALLELRLAGVNGRPLRDAKIAFEYFRDQAELLEVDTLRKEYGRAWADLYTEEFILQVERLGVGDAGGVEAAIAYLEADPGTSAPATSSRDSRGTYAGFRSPSARRIGCARRFSTHGVKALGRTSRSTSGWRSSSTPHRSGSDCASWRTTPTPGSAPGHSEPSWP